LAPEALQTTMVFKQTRDGYPVRQGMGVMPGPGDTFVAYGRGWANVSNTPFREYKHWVHEGGISTPLVVHWPAGFGARGELRNAPSHLIDLMATCVEVSGSAYPAESGGRKIKPMEGASLVPVFRGEPPRDRALFWEHERNGAVRQGKWKLVGKNVLGPEGPREDRWELYDIEADRPELEDLAARNPGKVRELSGLFMEYAKRGNVLPLPQAQPGGAKKK
jgi:arylsulfatase